MTQRRNLPNLHDRFSKKVFRNHSILLDASFSDLLCDAGPPRRADMINRSKGMRRPPDGVAVTPLAFFPYPPASPGGGIPDHPPLKGKGPCQPRTGLSCPLLRYAWVAPSPDGSVTPPAICLFPVAGCALPAIVDKIATGRPHRRFDHPLSFPLKGDPPPAL